MKNRDKRDKWCYECKMSRCHAITVMNVTQSNFAYGSSAYAVKSTSQSCTFTSINETFYHTFARFSVFPTLASGASIARGCPPPNGGALLAPSLRSRRNNIGQKPEPTYLFFTKRARSHDLAPKQRQYDSLIVKNKSEPISIYEIVRICYVW